MQYTAYSIQNISNKNIMYQVLSVRAITPRGTSATFSTPCALVFCNLRMKYPTWVTLGAIILYNFPSLIGHLALSLSSAGSFLCEQKTSEKNRKIGPTVGLSLLSRSLSLLFSLHSQHQFFSLFFHMTPLLSLSLILSV